MNLDLTANILRQRVITRQRTIQSMDLEKAGDYGANAMPPHISTLLSRQSGGPGDSLALGNQNPQHSVKVDLNVIAQDITDHATAERLEKDFNQLLGDCEAYLRVILNEDYDAIRRNLSHVLSERDGHRDAEMERILLKQEEDLTVRVSVLFRLLHNSLFR